MGWKDLPYWLKGGIIALIIWIIFFVLAGIVDFQIKGIIPPIIIGGLYNNLTTVVAYIENAIIYLIIGAIVGLIYGKIKKN